MSFFKVQMEPIVKDGKEIGYMIRGRDVLTGLPTVSLHFCGPDSIPDVPETRGLYPKMWPFESPKQHYELSLSW